MKDAMENDPHYIPRLGTEDCRPTGFLSNGEQCLISRKPWCLYHEMRHCKEQGVR